MTSTFDKNTKIVKIIILISISLKQKHQLGDFRNFIKHFKYFIILKSNIVLGNGIVHFNQTIQVLALESSKID